MSDKRSIKTIIFHGGILAMAGILVRIIGLLYRIPMVNIIGAEANGIYSAAFNVYNLMLVLSSYGLPMAVSKLVSARIENKKFKNAAAVFNMAMAISMVTGGLAGLFMSLGAGWIERTFYAKYAGIALPLKVLAPTVFIVSMLGVFRGFYQGQGTTIPTAVSQIIEQIVNAIVSVAAGYILMKKYINSTKQSGWGAAGGTLGTCTGAAAALVFLLVLFFVYYPRFQKKTRKSNKVLDESYSSIFKILVITLIPIIIGQTFYQISAMLDDMIYGKMMMGVSAKVVKTTMGNYSSSYVLLTSVVLGVASAMSASLLPSVVASKQHEDFETINEKLKATVKANMFIAMPCFIGLFVLGEPIVAMLFSSYDSHQGGVMLKLGAVAVIFYTLATVTTTTLQGIDKLNVPIYHNIVALAVHIPLLIILLKTTDLGIYAIVIGNASFPILVMLLNLISLYKYTGYTQEIIQSIGVPFGCALFMGICTYGVYKLFFNISGRVIIGLFFGFIIAAVTYFGSMFLYEKKLKPIIMNRDYYDD